MPKMIRILPALALGLVACNLALGPGAASADDTNADARKARILANLQVQFPQLKDMSPVMGEIKSSGIAGLDQGTFIVGGRQTQAFLVTADNKKFWMVSGEPLDVSKSDEEIKAALADQAKKEAEAAANKAKDLEAAIAGRPFRGNAKAEVTIVEFSDFQCPYCTRGAQTMEQVIAKYPNDVKFVFKHFPLNFHPWALPAAVAAECANNQKPEAFWALHDAYFKNQKDITPANLAEKNKEYLAGSGIDMAKFVACSEDKDTEEYKKASQTVNADMSLGGRLGVSGTPGFFVNGHFLNGAMPIEQFDEAIAKAKAK
jgi:protein-disulfide isomerase